MKTNGLNKKKADRIRIHVDTVPPSANHVWRVGAGRMYLTPEARRFFRAVAAAAWNVYKPDSWDAVDVSIYVRPKRRAGDVDNWIKPTLDAITRAGVWNDDRCVASVYCERLDPSDGSPGLWIEIEKSRAGAYPSGAPWR